MKPAEMTRLAMAACTLLVTVGCQQQSQGSASLLLDEPSASFLKREIDDAIAEYDQAEQLADSDPDEARQAFTRARDRLNHVDSYYLPLLEARERSYNAYQLCAHGQRDRASDELGLVEGLLLNVAKSEGENVEKEIEVPLAAIEQARLALDGPAEKAAGEIATLVRDLNALLYKGRLVAE